MSNTPSLRELLDFADAFDWNGWAVPKNAQAAFAKAVLAKWGTPQPVVREPLTPSQYNIALGCATDIPPSRYEAVTRAIERAHGITKGGSNADTRAN